MGTFLNVIIYNILFVYKKPKMYYTVFRYWTKLTDEHLEQCLQLVASN